MHIRPLVQSVQQHFSGDAAKRYTGEISRYHRIQASPGYREAATWLANTLRDNGLDVTVESYPADERSRFWTLPSFQEWACSAATLDWLCEDKSVRLCDYRATAVSVIQRSASANGVFEVVDAGDGKVEAYENIEVAGKLVLSRSPVRETYQRAVVERGAAGVLYDHITGDAPGRSRTDLPDVRQYASFWWMPEDQKSWGFVLTPRQGDALRAVIANGETVSLAVHIESEFYDGAMEAVIARIPGTDQELYQSVLGIAHLCHPQGFANDNASGVGCLLETATTLQQLIAGGNLPPPRRTITFLWVPEMTGTYAWLQAHEARIPGIIAGINLDMVGERQESTGSVMLLERPPDAMSSFAPDLLESLRAEIIAEQTSLDGNQRYARFRYATTNFSGGSDHIVTSDPSIGIPTPMFIQWPDRFYHTTADTMEHVDPQSLLRAGALTGSYLYWLAQAGAEEATWLGWDIVARYEQRLGETIQDDTTEILAKTGKERRQGWQKLARRSSYMADRALEAILTLQRFGDLDDSLRAWQAEIEESTDRVLDRSRRQIRPNVRTDAPLADDPWQVQAGAIVPVRNYRCPIMDMAAPLSPFTLAKIDMQRWAQLYEDVPGWRLLRIHAEFWVDGQRSLAEIADLVQLETGRAIGPAIELYFELLEKAEVMELQREV